MADHVDLVEISDDVSCDDNEVHIQPQAQESVAKSKLYTDLKSLQNEMEFRGTLLGKTWSELTNVMKQYQNTLIEKHEQYESCLDMGEQARLSSLENSIEKHKIESLQLQRRVSELEQKLLQKDGEIVRLRTEVHKFRNEVNMKDSLIQKLQNQMAQEAMEYQTEINSLKDLLESHNNGAHLAAVPVKRRKIGPKSSRMVQSQHTPVSMSSTDNCSYIKAEMSLDSSCQQSRTSSESMHLLHRGDGDGIMDKRENLETMSGHGMNESGPSLGEVTAGAEHSGSFFTEDYDLDEENHNDSSNMMDDLLEQKPVIDHSLVEPHLLVHNLHGSQEPSPQNLSAMRPRNQILEGIKKRDGDSDMEVKHPGQVADNPAMGENNPTMVENNPAMVEDNITLVYQPQMSLIMDKPSCPGPEMSRMASQMLTNTIYATHPHQHHLPPSFHSAQSLIFKAESHPTSHDMISLSGPATPVTSPRKHRQCPTCAKFILEANFARHRRQHLGIKPFVCVLCRKQFSMPDNGMRHIRLVHQQTSDPRNYLVRIR